MRADRNGTTADPDLDHPAGASPEAPGLPIGIVGTSWIVCPVGVASLQNDRLGGMGV